MTMRPIRARMRLGAAAVVFAVLAPTIGVAQSQRADAPIVIAGGYQGWVGGTQGSAAASATLTQAGATFTGAMTFGPYSFTVSEGRIDGEKLSWKFSDGNASGSAEATYKDGAISGSWWAMGTESGTFELRKSTDN